LFFGLIADFLLVLVELIAAGRREKKKGEWQAKGEQRREVQGSSVCRCNMCLGIPIPI